MVRHILDIGNSKYKLNKDALCEFLLEARHQNEASRFINGHDFGSMECESVSDSLDLVFREVMQLYNEYATTESLDALMKLKNKLEHVSSRYRSLALAEEVMNINSCLPYERRVQSGRGPSSEEEE
ncbi:MAG TPA: hypothetical protein DCZ75_14080 [Geobacter sp.]|nr:hypothetical protein [Geobacter sp.]